MHITFVTTHYPPSHGFGGVCESSRGLSVALARAGINVDVITSDATKGGRIPHKSFSDLEEPNLRISPFRYLVNEKSCFSIDAINVLKNHVPGSDLVHVNGIFTHPVTLGAWFARRYNKPHLIAIRNGLDPWLFKYRRLKKVLGFKLYVQNALLNADCIHATAPKEINECRMFGIKKPCTIIPNGINPYHFNSLPRPEVAEKIWPALIGKTVILFLSRLSPQKGLDLLIPAWDIVKKKFPNAFLVLAGSDYMGYSREVQKLVSASNFTDSILLTGNVKNEKKMALYSRANLFILPSYTENFGNVVAESLICGTPVITTQATPWQDLEKMDCGRWIPVSQHTIVLALLEMIGKSETDRKEMGRRGRRLILDKYTWDIAARKMISVYKAITGQKPVPLFPKP